MLRAFALPKDDPEKARRADLRVTPPPNGAARHPAPVFLAFLCAEQEVHLYPKNDRMEGLMVLHGWKQIAQYLGCGIRTAQRWEAQCGLPVTRPRNHLRSPVLAQSEALDSWAGGASAGVIEQWQARWAQIEREIELLKQQVETLVAGTEPLADMTRSTAERERGHASAGRQRSVAAKAPSFDA